MNLHKIRIDILNDVKADVIKSGWSEGVLKKIKKNNNHKTALITSLFPNGYFSLIQLYLDEINLTMTHDSKKLNLIRLKVHERIRELCILRLRIMSKEKKLISKTFFHLLLPQNYKFCLKNLYITVDQIWFLAGDSSTDFNFYSKRAILASIYSSTIIHFINNNDFQKTINLLNKQLNRVSKIPNFKNRLNDAIKFLPHLFKLKKNFNFTRQ